MSIPLSDKVRKLLESKAYGHIVTFNPDGNAQLSMVWIDVDGDEVLFNTAEGRLKPRNLRRDPRIVISVQDPQDAQSHAVFYGTATVTTEGADGQIDKLAKRFLGLDTYPYRQEGEVRLTVRTKVDRISGMRSDFQPWT